jgi:hypothetical protein
MGFSYDIEPSDEPLEWEDDEFDFNEEDDVDFKSTDREESYDDNLDDKEW